MPGRDGKKGLIAAPHGGGSSPKRSPPRAPQAQRLGIALSGLSAPPSHDANDGMTGYSGKSLMRARV
jgi:hypothetical protein